MRDETILILGAIAVILIVLIAYWYNQQLRKKSDTTTISGIRSQSQDVYNMVDGAQAYSLGTSLYQIYNTLQLNPATKSKSAALYGAAEGARKSAADAYRTINQLYQTYNAADPSTYSAAIVKQQLDATSAFQQGSFVKLATAGRALASYCAGLSTDAKAPCMPATNDARSQLTYVNYALSNIIGLNSGI